MSVLRFGRSSANMLDPFFFGFGGLLSSPEPTVDFSGSLITLADPDSGAVLSMIGTFDDTSEWALLASPVTGIAMIAGDGAPLFDWSGLPITLGTMFGGFDPTLLMQQGLEGDDSVLGSTEADFLFGDLPGWHQDLVVENPLAPGGRLAISADGSMLAGVVWRETIPGDPASARQDVVLIDPASGAQRMMSAPDVGAQSGTSAFDPSLSRDGRMLVFRTDDPAFGAPDASPGTCAVVARDTLTGAVVLVSVSADGVAARGVCEAPVISADGSRVAFTSGDEALLPGGLPSGRQVYLKALSGGEISRVSSDADGVAANGDSFGAAVSLDGRFVAFASYATNLVPGPVPDLGANVFVKDTWTGEVRLVASLGNGATLPDPADIGLAISLDGAVVAFSSAAPGLVPDDTNGAPDVFVMRMASGEIERASVDEWGMQAPMGAGSIALALSGDGLCVAFHTREGGLTEPGSAEWGNVYLRDFATGVLYRLSDPAANNAWSPVAMSADALSVVFTQTLPALGSGDGETQLVLASQHGLGPDFVAGGPGDDAYFAEVGDRIEELPGEGDDTVVTVWPEWSLSDNVENLLYGGHGFFSGTGNALDNLIGGGALSDRLRGGAGNDSFDGAAGGDLIEGGEGRDCALYDASITGFVLRAAGQGLLVEDRSAALGTDHLESVERLDFTDMDVNLVVQSDAASIDAADLARLCELYVGLFGRVPAADGLEYWIGRVMDGRPLELIAEDFYNAGASPELRQFTGYWDFTQDAELGDEAFVRVVYRNVLGREGLDAGVNYWTALLTSSAETRGSLVTTMLDAAHGLEGDAAWGWVGRLLDDRTGMSLQVAVDWGLNYAASPQQAIEKGMAIASAVRELPNAAFPDIPIKVFDFDVAVMLVGIDPESIQLAVS